MNLATLARAVHAADAWKGNVTGDDLAEEKFDRESRKRHKVLSAVYRMRRGVRRAIARCDAAGQYTIANELRELLK